MIYYNASWPKGKWKLDYDKKDDKYYITTEYNEFIASVASTLIAYWLVRTYNTIFFPAE